MPPNDAATEDFRQKILAKAFSSFINFCAILEIKDKTGKYVPFVLNTIQRMYFEAMTARDIVVKGRQVGMTTLLLALDIYRFLTEPGVNVLVMCQSKQDNGPRKKVIAELQHHFDTLAKLGVRVDFNKSNQGSWSLDNGATLTVDVAGASPKSAEKTSRGGTVQVLHCTEVAYWDLAADTWNGLSNCVPPPETGSRIVLECTPNGASGFFYDQWVGACDGSNGFEAQFFPWFLQKEYRTALAEGEVIVPINDLERQLEPEQVKWYRRKSLGEKGHLVQQEYPSDRDSCFLGSGRGFFDSGKVLGMLAVSQDYEAPDTFIIPRSCKIERSDVKASSKTFAQLRTVRVFYRPEPDRDYLLSLDPSEGVGLDATAGIVLERGTGRHMATLWGQFKPEEAARLASVIAKEFNWAEIVVERANHGHAVRVALTTDYEHSGLKAPYPHLFRDHDGKFGWINTLQSRTTALDHLEQAVRLGPELGGFGTQDVWLLRELKDFVVIETASGKARAEAARGKHDDMVMALCIAWNCISRRRVRRDVSALPPA